MAIETAPAEHMLSVRNLCLYFRTRAGIVQAVDDVSFDLDAGRTLAIIGESGCGKSSLAKALLRMLPRNVRTYKGSVLLNGTDLMKLSNERFRRDVRWVKVAMVPQAAMNSLNPVIKVQQQVAEPLLIHGKIHRRREAYQKVREMFGKLGLPTDFLTRYAFELSGGMRQRATIAMALIADPQVVLLDEPTSALDLLTQANIMNVLKRIKNEIGVTFILITHDIGTASELADDIAVIYAGQIVEIADAQLFYTTPLHPYSQKLMASVPTLWEEKKLEFIPGQPPSLIKPPQGCRFADRCDKRMDKCNQAPPVVKMPDGRTVRCWLYSSGE